jgi:DNA-binding Lrp family transcriptional regulator
MKLRDIKTLLLLEAIEKDENQSQRELSKKLDISLGQANKFIKELSVQEILKSVSFKKGKFKYIITTKGEKEKIRLARRYLSHSIRYYKDVKRRLAKVFSLLERSQRRDLVLFGAGEICEIACILIREDGCFSFTVVDDEKVGSRICGKTIRQESEINDLACDAIVIMQLEKQEVSRKKLLSYGIPPGKIFCIS